MDCKGAILNSFIKEKDALQADTVYISDTPTLHISEKA